MTMFFNRKPYGKAFIILHQYGTCTALFTHTVGRRDPDVPHTTHLTMKIAKAKTPFAR